jgi:putative transposase
VIYLAGGNVRLPKLGLVKCRASRPHEGRILSATVFQVPSGKYFVSLCCTGAAALPFPRTGKAVGLHFGINDLAVTSDGQAFANGRHREKARKKLSRLARRLSRKARDGANREKARIALAKAHERVKNQKTDALQKLTTALVRGYDTICVRREPLDELMKARPYASRLADAGWGALVSLLKYKCAWHGRDLVEVASDCAGAQLCSACGHRAAGLAKGKTPEWACPSCGARRQRAQNAALDTLNEGLRTAAL